ncbi:hypothetical protein O9992_08560 [Vibrio lentus]|nr:hypothetical protein [Vibrio lentus]
MVGDPKEQNIHLMTGVTRRRDRAVVVRFRLAMRFGFAMTILLTFEQIRLGVQQIGVLRLQQFFIYNCTSRIDFIDGNQEVETFQI